MIFPELGTSRVRAMNNKPPELKPPKLQPLVPMSHQQDLAPEARPVSLSPAPATGGPNPGPSNNAAHMNHPSHPYIKPHPTTTHNVPILAKKSKPVPIAVLPKPSKNLKSTFNPNMNLHVKHSPSIKLKQDVGLNINTTKKWVLPPRPRPGRKPVNLDEPEDHKSKSQVTSPTIIQPHSHQNTTRTSDHQVLEKKLEDGNQDTKLEKPKHKIDKKCDKSYKEKLFKEKLFKEKGGKDKPKPKPHGKKPETDPEIMNLKMNYLSKLKEQELINNYIDIINNQIKQLTFIKNGYMTLDTLNQINPNIDPNENGGLNLDLLKDLNNGNELHSESELFRNLNLNTSSDNSSPSVSGNSSGFVSPNISDFSSPDPEGTSEIKTRNSQDLESINNPQDLDKFLNYLLKSSNLIHRVTKNYKSDNDYGNINSQITKYLRLRSNYQKLHNCNKLQYKKAKLNSHQTQNNSDYKIDTLLNENNLFDKLIINNFDSELADLPIKDPKPGPGPAPNITNGTGPEVKALKCSICKKLTPCFCLDIDRKFMDNDYA